MDIKRQLIEYFIKKFEVIPDEEFGGGGLWEQCVLWHCGLRAYSDPTSEAIALLELFKGHEITLDAEQYVKWDAVYVVNDVGPGSDRPKGRILYKLNTLLNEKADRKNSF